MISFARKSTRLLISDLAELFDSHQDSKYADALCPRSLCQAIEQVDSRYMLHWLSEHTCSSVRGALAASRKLTNEIMWKLACDPSLRVRYQLACNSALPGFVLECLAEDEDKLVAQRAIKTLNAGPPKPDNLIFGFFSANPKRKTG